MRTVLKYIGILLIINCSMGNFAVEMGEKLIQTLMDLRKPIMEFSVELTSKFHNIEAHNTPESQKDHNYQNLQKQIDELEEKFGSNELYNEFIMMDGLSFQNIARFSQYEPLFVFRNKQGQIIENYANNCILYEDAIDENVLLLKAHNFLPSLFDKSYPEFQDSCLQYQNLCKKTYTTSAQKEQATYTFFNIFNKFFQEEPYFKDIFNKFDGKINKGDLGGAFIELTLKFSILKSLLTKDGLPHNFKITSDMEKGPIDYFNRQKSQKTDEEKEIGLEQINKILGKANFKFIDIGYRAGFFKLFKKKIKNFMDHPNFPIWIKNNNNVRSFVCFYCGFFEEIFASLRFLLFSKHIGSITKNAYIDKIQKDKIQNLFKYKETFSIVREDLSEGNPILKGIESFHNRDEFRDIMESFLHIFYGSFKEYFLVNMFNPSPSQEIIASIDITKEKKKIKVKTPLTNMEKNLLKFSNSLNTTLKEFFQKTQPSKADFNNTLFAVEKIKNQFFGSIVDLKIKYMNPLTTNEYFDTIALPIFLTVINPENSDLYNKFMEHNKQPQHQEEEKVPAKSKKAKDLMEKKSQPSKAPVVPEEEKVPAKPVENFSKQNLKKMSAATSKQYKKKSPGTMEIPTKPLEQEDTTPVLNQSQKKILEASKAFYDIYENKHHLYESYKSSLNNFKNNLDNCINLMEIPVGNGKNPLTALIKKLENSGEETEPLDNIKDKINDTKTYEDNGTWIPLDDSLNFDQINKLIKKENEKVENFHKIIQLLSTANDYLNELITNGIQEESDENPTVVDFPTKNSLVVAPIRSQPFYQSGHNPKIQGEPGQEGPTARIKKKQKKPEEVEILFQDAIDQEKEREEAEKKMKEEEQKNQEEEKKREECLEEGKKELRKIGAQELQVEREKQEKRNQEQIKAIVEKIERQFSLQKKALQVEREQQEQANQEQIKAIVQQIELKFSLQKKQ